MTLTIWSNAGKHEFLIRAEDGTIISRSGLVYASRAQAKREAMKVAASLPA